MSGGKGRDKKSKQFSEHTNEDNTATRQQQQQQLPSSGSADEGAAATTATTTTDNDLPALTWVGKIILFFGFPLIVGLLGLYAGYLQKREDPTKQLNFDDDFAYPFVLALTLVVVIGFRTGGFTSTKQKPLVSWPKMKKRRKIIHKHVVAGQDPNFDDNDDNDASIADDEPEKDDVAKKDD